jgi:hypothetical protein
MLKALIKSLENKPLNPGLLSPNELGEEPKKPTAPSIFLDGHWGTEYVLRLSAGSS